MKVYEAVFKEGVNEGVYAISLVESPAMEDEWVALSKQKEPEKLQFSAVDDKRRLLLGAVLIPNKEILRVDADGNKFAIKFSSKTIEELSHNWIKQGNQNNSTAEHEIQLNGVSFVETWQVDDPKIDKSALYGKNYKKGTWVAMAKVSPELYKQATDGTFKGFSIDALLGLEQIKLNTNINSNSMTKQDFLDAFKAIFSAEEKEQEVEKIEVVAEEVAEEVAEPAMNVDALKEALTETLAQFSANVDEKINTLKVEFSNTIAEKDAVIETKTKEVEDLQVELNKQPEVESVKLNQTEDVTPIKMTGKTIQERVFSAING